MFFQSVSNIPNHGISNETQVLRVNAIIGDAMVPILLGGVAGMYGPRHRVDLRVTFSCVSRNINLKHKAMRKLFVNPVIALAVVASVLMLSSCEKDAVINEADLVGTWDMGQVSVDVKVGPISLLKFLKTTMMMGDEAAQAIVDQIASEFSDIGGTIPFNEDYSYQMVDGDLGELGSWELEGDKLHMTVTGETPDDPLIVRSLSSTAALVAWEEEEPMDVNEDGTDDFTATIIIELNLSKQ